MIEPENILTPAELAQRLKVRPSWVYEKMRRRSDNPLPCFKIGRYLRFDWPRVCDWLESTSNVKPKGKRREDRP